MFFNLIAFVMKFSIKINYLFIDFSWPFFKIIIEFSDKIIVIMIKIKQKDWGICTFSPNIKKAHKHSLGINEPLEAY